MTAYRLYPFDTYSIKTTLRAETQNETGSFPLQLTKLVVVPMMWTWGFTTVREGSVRMNQSFEAEVVQGRYIELGIYRPDDARLYAMAIFALNWALTHFSLGLILIAILRSSKTSSKDALQQLAGVLAILLVIPQLRLAMPDSPDFEGVILGVYSHFCEILFLNKALCVQTTSAFSRR